MKVIRIVTEPFAVTDIEECTIIKTVNQHFQAAISGSIYFDESDPQFSRMMESIFVIKAITEEGEELSLFRGRISGVQLNKTGDTIRIRIQAQSNTSLLDRETHTRTFQGSGQTYRQIVDQILGTYQNTAVIQPKGKGEKTRGLVVQYEETDWQFLKRMASQLNTVLVPDCTNDDICLFFGNPERPGKEHMDMTEYRMRRYTDVKLGESIEYIVNSRTIHQLCERVYVNGNPYYVYHIMGRIEHQQMEFRYTLRPAAGFDVQEIKNTAAAGCSIMGKVREVHDTRVKVKLYSEADYEFGKSLWFPFSTVYSSPDGTGWYCMPEKGDRIRLHIPETAEEEAQVISAVHLEADDGLREDPDIKSIRTKYDKEIRLTPDKIVLTNHKGTSITLDDKRGIIIKSSRGISMSSQHGIEINGEQVQIEGGQGVFLLEGPNMLMVRDGIKEQGMNIEHR